MSEFSIWYQENKESDDLNESYQEYRSEMEYSGDKPLTFRQWCKEAYETEQEV